MIQAIRLSRFRNYREEEVFFSDGINVFLGQNGHGKTNLLEAVYFLGMLSSFRKAEAKQMIRQGEQSLSLEGRFAGDEAVSLSVERGEAGWMRLMADGSPCTRKTDYIGRVGMVVFSAEEMELIQGSPEVRRRYLDRTCFAVDRRHLKHLKAYRRALKQRNLLLRQRGFRRQELDSWSERLAEAGARVVRGRQEVTALLNGRLAMDHPFLDREAVSLLYRGTGSDETETGRIAEKILEALAGVRKEEEARRMTLAGPHRDDLEIVIDGTGAKAFSSRGEMRSILLALKAAEVETFRGGCDRSPLILLDDVASELDAGRRLALLRYLREKEGQVLITTTEAENLPPLDGEKDRIFRVEEGKIINQ